MLFLLKRTWQGGLLGLALLVPLGLAGRHFLGDVPPLNVSLETLGQGVAVFALVLLSDGILHQLITKLAGERYHRRFQEWAGLFQQQSRLAIVAGALLAGLGEELVFRGLTSRFDLLLLTTVLFGLLHHVRRDLWPFTLWAAYQGLLFALVLHLCGSLFVTMTAHFLHDGVGFVFLRAQRREETPTTAAA